VRTEELLEQLLHDRATARRRIRMNENENTTEAQQPGFFKSVVGDDGVQRAAAGVIVAVIVAGAKELIFGGRK
jgi:hypothetical protein